VQTGVTDYSKSLNAAQQFAKADGLLFFAKRSPLSYGDEKTLKGKSRF
jgi:hypothetical protein